MQAYVIAMVGALPHLGKGLPATYRCPYANVRNGRFKSQGHVPILNAHHIFACHLSGKRNHPITRGEDLLTRPRLQINASMP